MYEEVSVPAQSRSQRVGRPKRLIWVAALFVAAAFSFGAAPAFSGGAMTSTATPEDPCLLNNTCDEQQRIAEDQARGDELQAHCDALKQLGIFTPECVPVEPAPTP